MMSSNDIQTIVDGSTTGVSGVWIASSNPTGDQPPTISKGEDIKPPTCYNCGDLVYDFEKIMGHVYCQKCIKEFAEEWIHKLAEEAAREHQDRVNDSA